jgi:predicted amidohydrolase
MSRRLRLAAAQYDIGHFGDLAEYEAKLARWVAEAAAEGAEMLVFPEYGSMELGSVLARKVQRDLQAQLATLQPLLPAFLALHARLAATHGVYLCAASFPVQVAPGDYRNRAHIFSPTGAVGYQDKQVMTRFERERWRISRSNDLRVFATDLGTIAVNLCYDAEFPLIARAQVEAGAELLLVPSCTDTLAGYHRVRIACRARALEGQCYVVQAPTVGEAAWSEAVDTNVGAAGVFAPPDVGFPNDGLIASGELNRPGWLCAEIDLDEAAHVRKSGQVLNYRDWSSQTSAAGLAVERVALA